MDNLQKGTKSFQLPQVNPPYQGKCVIWKTEEGKIILRLEFGTQSVVVKLGIEDLLYFFEMVCGRDEVDMGKFKISYVSNVGPIYHECDFVHSPVKLSLKEPVGPMGSRFMWVDGEKMAKIVHELSEAWDVCRLLFVAGFFCFPGFELINRVKSGDMATRKLKLPISKKEENLDKKNGLPNGKKKPVKGVFIQMQFDFQKLVWIAVIVLMGLSLLELWFAGKDTGKEIQLSQALADVKSGKIDQVEVYSEKLVLKYKDNEMATSRKEPNESFTEILDRAKIDPTSVSYDIKDQTLGQMLGAVLPSLLGTGVVILVLLYMFRQARGAQDSIFSFGQSRAKLFDKGKQSTKFADVAGVDEAKKELEEVVDFLKNPGKYKAVGARTPKGVLLVGASGVGKTLLARAVAGEAGVPFFSMAGSEFMEMLVGVGSARVRDLFGTAKKAAPAIIFIDEIDAIGRQRGNGLMGGHDEREQTLNQILVEMDGFTPNDNVVVLAATNRGDLLDPALLRPGRFDRRVVVELPDIEGRQAILKIYAKNKPFVEGMNWEAVAKRTVGFSGADLENMLNEAAIDVARNGRTNITMKDVEEAATKVKLGPQKKRIQSELDRKMTSYHEVGHAITTWAQSDQGLDPVHRISIVSRGMTLGHTLVPPTADRVHETKRRLLAMITMMLGGRAAEELVFGEMTTGAANDIDKATKVARDMVMEYGMSSLGPINYGPQQDAVDWGKGYYEPTPVSQEMQSKIDTEVRSIIDHGYENAVKLLKQYRKKLDVVSLKLLETENMDGDEFEALMSAK